MKNDAVHVGLIGCGTIGTGVVRCLLEHDEHIKRHLGFPVELTRIAELRPLRGLGLPRGTVTKDARKIIDDPHIEIVVELIGGTTVAKDFILESMQRGKHVVTANKALIAKHGMELHKCAQQHGVDLFYEASVAGGIPIIKALREGFTANRIDSVCGILNGTCNYVLSCMEDEGRSYDEAVAQAQREGYAEADPTLDVGGNDAQHKLGILALLAFGQWVPQKSMYVEGITNVTAFDITCAQHMGYTIKLLAIGRADGDAIETRIHPAFIPLTSPFANVKGAYNAIQVDGYPIGRTMFYGMGAGREPTSSAVVADIIDIARNIGHSAHERMPTFTFGSRTRSLRGIEDVRTQYYLRCTVKDEPGVIAQIAHELGARDISLSSVLQHESETAGESAIVTFMTHVAREGAVREALGVIDALPCAQRPTVMFRVEQTAEEGDR